MLPASPRPGCRVHRDSTSACASAGASLVPSPIIATSLPGSALRESGAAWFPELPRPEVIDPDSFAIAAAVSGFRGNHDGA